MTIVDDQIAAMTAALTPLVGTPVTPYGYGVDLSLTSDITDTADEVASTSTRAIGEALIRRLSTAHGTLFDDLDYGLDLVGLLNRGVTDADLAVLAGRIKNECSKDDRVSDVLVSVSYTNYVLSVGLTVTPAIATESFKLTFAIVDGALTLEAFA